MADNRFEAGFNNRLLILERKLNAHIDAQNNPHNVKAADLDLNAFAGLTPAELPISIKTEKALLEDVGYYVVVAPNPDLADIYNIFVYAKAAWSEEQEKFISEPLSVTQFEIPTGNGAELIRAELDVVEKKIIFTKANGSMVYCDLTALFALIEGLREDLTNLGSRITAVENNLTTINNTLNPDTGIPAQIAQLTELVNTLNNTITGEHGIISQIQNLNNQVSGIASQMSSKLSYFYLSNVTLYHDNWHENTNPEQRYRDYAYSYALQNDLVKSALKVYVIYDTPQATSGDYCALQDINTTTGTITFYSNTPDTITIPWIDIFK